MLPLVEDITHERYCTFDPSYMLPLVEDITHERYCTFDPSYMLPLVEDITHERYCTFDPSYMLPLVEDITHERYCTFDPSYMLPLVEDTGSSMLYHMSNFLRKMQAFSSHMLLFVEDAVNILYQMSFWVFWGGGGGGGWGWGAREGRGILQTYFVIHFSSSAEYSRFALSQCGGHRQLHRTQSLYSFASFYCFSVNTVNLSCHIYTTCLRRCR